MLDWDQKQPWVLYRFRRELKRVTIRFHSVPP